MADRITSLEIEFDALVVGKKFKVSITVEAWPTDSVPFPDPRTFYGILHEAVGAMAKSILAREEQQELTDVQ